VTAGAWVVIQELGVAPVLVTSGAQAAGSAVAATTGATVTASAVATSVPIGFFGFTLDATVVNTISRVDLQLPTRQG
jgi:hypothetical protein